MDTITTQRLILRNFRKEDGPDLFAYLREPTTDCFLSMKLDDLTAARSEAARRGDSDDYIAVCLHSTRRMIGDLFAIAEGDTYAVGWNFNPDAAGKGYAFEAADAMIVHLFTTASARRLYAYVQRGNDSSARLCEKLGMRREGEFKEYVSFKNDPKGIPVFEDTFQYALLRNEWIGRQLPDASLSSLV